jgi:predicted RNA-binding protein associated with RNAse of E/G family
LIKYTNNNNELNEKKYFFDVFSKNVDIWGFLTLYLDIILITKNYQVNKRPLINLVKKYLYSEKYATNMIPENKLIEELKKLKLLSFNKTKKLIK